MSQSFAREREQVMREEGRARESTQVLKCRAQPRKVPGRKGFLLGVGSAEIPDADGHARRPAANPYGATYWSLLEIMTDAWCSRRVVEAQHARYEWRSPVI